ncbi:hypothetical protein BpHYR1_006350 [Brachionus plicatilis]|uniref:Uncharacterized protein n=1 Tax=Brachionus plicatilis TaxID=10195 RepID=A0A3M7P7N3_BRAPC|nr:hypothetical protein BpHYR1_006350 [Brachionus plicatilis]
MLSGSLFLIVTVDDGVNTLEREMIFGIHTLLHNQIEFNLLSGLLLPNLEFLELLMSGEAQRV